MKKIKGWLVFLVVIMLFGINISFANENDSLEGMAIDYRVSDIEDLKLEIKGVTAVKLGDEIEIRVYYKEGKISLYSFFNPPHGDEIKIMGNPSEKVNEEGVLKFKSKIEELKNFKEMTILVQDEDSSVGWIFLRPQQIDYEKLPEAIFFQDEKLEGLVRSQIDKETGDISEKELRKIKTLHAKGKGVTSLVGLENLTQLEYLDLRDNNISDIDKISLLTNLHTLYLDDNLIDDYTPLKSIYNNLTETDFSDKILEFKIKDGSFKDLNMIKENEDLIINYTASKFSDVPKEEWFTKNVSSLLAMKIIDGYEDGTFKPNGEVTADAFIKMIVTALGYELENGAEYWASNFIDKAIELELIKENEFINYRRQITRGEMARIIARVLEANGEEKESIEEYEIKITDYNSIADDLRDYVLTVYVGGIITGYEDGEFKADKTVTRAVASTTILRLLDINSRVKPPKKPLELISTWPWNGQEYTIFRGSLISLNFSKDMDGKCDLSKISVVSEYGDKIPVKRTFTASQDASEFYVSCNSKLDLNTEYTVTIEANTLETLEGDKYDKKIEIKFKVGDKYLDDGN